MEEHPVQDMMRLMASKVRSIANRISDEEVESLIREILGAGRVYVTGDRGSWPRPLPCA
jgi:6-phospho-3-hexuloisomerase